jgi:hypothetical protein
MSSVIPRMHLHPVRTAWLGLVVGLALHVADEALTGFLEVYNPTVRALRDQLGWFPMPQFRFEAWLTGLIAFVAGLALLTPLVERGPRVVRAVAVVFAGLMVLNGTAHIAGTVAGRSVHGALRAPDAWILVLAAPHRGRCALHQGAHAWVTGAGNAFGRIATMPAAAPLPIRVSRE